MVDILVHRGQPHLAHRLEILWNEVIEESNFELLCTYLVDDLAAKNHGHGEAIHRISGSHTHLLTPHDVDEFEAAVSEALASAFPLEDASRMRALLTGRATDGAHMPDGERVLMALFALDPHMGGRVLSRTRELLAA